MTWAKGQSGNPAGRKVDPHAAAWRRALKEAVTPEDFRFVVLVLLKAAKKGETWAVRDILDRCLGRPQQSMDITGGLTLAEWIAQEEGQETSDAG